MKCYAEHYCKKNKQECSEICGGYRVLKALYTLSKIPIGYQYNIPLVPEREDLPKYEELNEYMKSIEEMVAQGRGLYIWSSGTGTGKTSWACKIMGYYFRKIAFKSGLEYEGLYIFLPTFLEDLRASYDNPDPEFDDVLEYVRRCKLLIIDDIGAEKPSEWVRERLLSFINTRVSNELTTIYTSNLSLDRLREKMGDRIVSRITGSTKEIELVGRDQRGREK